MQAAPSVPWVLSLVVSEGTVFSPPEQAAPAGAGPPGVPAAASAGDPPATPGKEETKPEVLPVWKADCGELWYDGELILEFKQAAPNQRRLLTEFQEHGWPHWLEDPLAVDPSVDSRDRLRRTVEALNKSLKNTPLAFHVTDAGQGVKWSVRNKSVSRRTRRGRRRQGGRGSGRD